MALIPKLLGIGQEGPKAAQLINPTSIDQTNNAYTNTQMDASQQQALLNALRHQGGIQNQSNVYDQQQALANQLQGVANGTGPNPAQAQLANSTGNNIAAQSALMAGQRGAGANVGLLARQIGQQGANINQQSAGQAAALQAQQQLGAMGALQQQQGMLGNLATQQVGQQSGALQNLNAMDQNEQNMLLNSVAQQNNSRVGNQNSINAANASSNDVLYKLGGAALGGALGGAGVGTMVSSVLPGDTIHSPVSNGGFAQGGIVDGPISIAGKHLKGFAKGGPVSGTMLAAHGKQVPGKAAVKGNSLKNDTVPAMLSPGEIVIPRNVVNSKDAPDQAARFVAAVLAKKGKK